jgi:hypothetical protein
MSRLRDEPAVRYLVEEVARTGAVRTESGEALHIAVTVSGEGAGPQSLPKQA